MKLLIYRNKSPAFLRRPSRRDQLEGMPAVGAEDLQVKGRLRLGIRVYGFRVYLGLRVLGCLGFRA